MRLRPVRTLGALVMAGVALAASLAVATPAQAKAETISTGVGLGSGSSVLVTCDFSQSAVTRDGAPAIRKWRQDALDDTRVKIDGKTVAAYLSEKGISRERYLDPQPSSTLERIAIQRAVEMRGAGELSHTRPNGESCFTATVEGVASNGEIIAWGTSDISSTVDLWASEKDDFIRTGRVDASTGHYYSLICPEYHYFGFAGTGTYWSGEFFKGEAPGGLVDGSDEGLGVAKENLLDGTYQVAFNLPTKDVAGGATLDQSSVGVNKTVELSATYKGMPVVASGWQTSDPGVLAVEGEGATGVKMGKATLTMRTSDGTAVPFEMLVGAQYMYRLYNPYTGEHFYTASAFERDANVRLGWNDEGLGWIAPDEGQPVYRLYNPYAPGGDHHYTTSAVERDHLASVGWNDEGVGWSTAGEDGVALYRQYNPFAETGTHNYTTSKYENDELVKLGWNAEGVAWYGVDL